MVSLTVTVALPVDELLLPSVAVSVTVFAPTSEQLNEVLLAIKVTVPQLSVIPPSMSFVVIDPLPFASRYTVASFVKLELSTNM